jgi:hypothetical protein
MLTVLLVLLAVMFVISMPTWRHSRSWGYRRSLAPVGIESR